MAAKTTTEQLESIQDAIDAVLANGQSVSKGDRRVEFAQLSTLMEQKERLERQLVRENSGPLHVRLPEVE